MSRQIPLLGIVPEKPDPNDNKFHVAIKTADGAVVSEALLDENFQPIPSGGGGETVEKIIVDVYYFGKLNTYYYDLKTSCTINGKNIIENAFMELRQISHTYANSEKIEEYSEPNGYVRQTFIVNKNDPIVISGNQYTNLREPTSEDTETWYKCDDGNWTNITSTTATLDFSENDAEYHRITIFDGETISGGYGPDIYYTKYGKRLGVGDFGGEEGTGIGNALRQFSGIYIDNDGYVYIHSMEKDVKIYNGDGAETIFQLSSGDIHMNTPYGSIYHNGTVVSTGSGCLVKGTMITMADGSKKAIEDVHSGDEVLSYDFEHQTTVPAVVLFNTEHEATVYSRKQLFSDGSTLETVGEHYVYNVNGSACSDIQVWDTGDAAQKADGSVVNYCGYISCASEMTRNWNLLTSNNTYYANDILNTCWPGTKFKMLAARGIKMPTELYEAVKQEFDYHRNGTTKANNAEFIAAVKDVEQQCSALDKTISVNKKKLTNTDYQMVKTSEQINDAILDSKDFDDFKSKVAAIYSKEFTKKVDERKVARDAIVAVEEQSAQLYDQVRQIKRQFGVWSEFEDMTTREQFMVCNKLGCENLEGYRAWDFITKAKEIFAPKKEVNEEAPKEETKSTKKKK